MLDIALIQQCAGQMPSTIAQAIVKTESGFKPFAIGVNRGTKLARQPRTYSEAVSIAKNLIAQGANIDLGLAQINSKNLNWLGLTVEQVFNPCQNLRAMQTVYLNCLKKSGNHSGGALSCYNTGNTTNGFRNGYVAKVMRNHQSIQKNSTPSFVPMPVVQVQIKKPKEKTLETSQTQVTDIPQQDSEVVAKVYNSWDIFQEF